MTDEPAWLTEARRAGGGPSPRRGGHEPINGLYRNGSAVMVRVA